MTTLARLMAWFIHCREVASRRAAETREIVALDRGQRTATEPVGPFTEDN